MSTTFETLYDYDLNGGPGADTLTGGAGNDKVFGGAGSDRLDGGGGSDDLKGGSGDDTLVYTLSQHTGPASDVYTGGSGVDTLRLQLTLAEWTSPPVRAELERYIGFMRDVSGNTKGEISNALESDFVFSLPGAATLKVQMLEKLEVAVRDGSGQYVVIDHLAALITGASTGALVEAGGVANALPGTPTATGDLYADDLDGPDDAFQAAVGAASYGTWGVTAAGVWTYTLDNTNASVQALNVGSTPLTDSFTVYSADGTAQVVSITIDGSNDAAVITGDSSGAVVEAGGVANATPGTPTASGDLLATDVDDPADTFQQVAAGATSANGYGTWGVTAAGVWTYTLDNTNASVQALNNGGTLSDSFTVLSLDGTAQVVNITINGATDITNAAPTGITLLAVNPGDKLPDAGTMGALSTSDPDVGDTHTYSIVAGSNPIFDLAGSSLTTSAGMKNNMTYTVTIRTTDGASAAHEETFNFITGSGDPNTLPTGGAGTGDDDVLYGFNNADTIYGGAGDDSLFGQNGNDTLYGGAGRDVLTGGDGNDVFVFNSPIDGATNVDLIADFVSGSDRIHLENTGSGLFNALSTGPLAAAAFDVVGVGPAATASTRVVYDPATGRLWYDADGTGATAAIQVAVIGATAHPSLANTDIVVI